MKKITIILCLVILLSLFALPASAINCKVVITKDQAYLDKWQKTPGQDPSKIPQAQFILKNENFSILLFLNNYKVNKKKAADIEYNIRITNPEGKVYLEKQKIKAPDTNVLNPNLVLLSKENIDFCFKSEDKAGDYTVEVNLKDKLAKETKSYKSTVKLIDFVYQPQLTDEQSFNEWMNSYYNNPSPEKAIDAFLFYAQIMLSKQRATFIPTLSFFVEIFNDNTYLFPYLIDLYGSQNYTVKICIIYLLRYCNYDAKHFIDKIGPDEKDTYEKLLTENLIVPNGEINNQSQLDILRNIFLGSGSYQPIKKLIDTLALSEYKGYQIKYNTSEKTEEDRQKAINDVIYQATIRTLKNIYTLHPLVKDYCIYAYENEQLPESVKSELKEILGK